MNTTEHQVSQGGPPGPDRQAAPANGGRKPFEAPRMRFIEPKLTAQGSLTGITKGFFGNFSP